MYLFFQRTGCTSFGIVAPGSYRCMSIIVRFEDRWSTLASAMKKLVGFTLLKSSIYPCHSLSFYLLDKLISFVLYFP